MKGLRFRSLGGLLFLLAGSLAAGCADDPPAEPETSGVADIEAVPYEPDISGDRLEAVSLYGERTVLIAFTTGTCSTPEAASMFPETLDVAYLPDQIILVMDTRLECDNDAIGVDRAALVDLEEPIGDRNVLLCRLGHPTVCLDENTP